MLNKESKPKITHAGETLADRIAPFRINDSKDPRAINTIVRKIESYERQWGGVWGVALLYQSSLGGIYKIMSKEEYKQYKPTVVMQPISFWPKSYFLDLRQRLLQNAA